MRTTIFDRLRWLVETWQQRSVVESVSNGKDRTGAAFSVSSVLALALRILRRGPGKVIAAGDELALLRDGWAFAPLSQPDDTLKPRSIAYLAYNALPYHSAGYAVRTQSLVESLIAQSYDVNVLMRAGYPELLLPDAVAPDRPDRIVIHDVPYHRVSGDKSRLSRMSTTSYIRENVRATTRTITPFRPAVIHGASNFVTGLSAVELARNLGAKSIYEVRGLWEITAASRDPNYTKTLKYKQAVRLETDACRAADRVIAITQGLKKELIERGVDGDTIDVVPNGVDTRRFRPRDRDGPLAQSLGIDPDDVVIGFIGSIVDYEGIDDLLVALASCRTQTKKSFRLLIVGDGAVLGEMKQQAKRLGMCDLVTFTGRVPNNQVEDYYSLIDIAPFPRKPLQVCEVVSPLKPFEAMAMETCVIASDVAALAEMVSHDRTGLLFRKGETSSLTEMLLRVIDDTALRSRLASAGRSFVVSERDWAVLGRQVADIYDTLTTPPTTAPDVQR